MTRLQAVLVVTVGCSGAALPADIPAPRPALSAAEVEQLQARGRKFADRGQIDLFVAATAAWKLRAEDERLWLPAHAVGRTAIEKAGLADDRRPNGPAAYPSFAKYLELWRPLFVRTDGLYRRHEDEVQLAPGRIRSTEVVLAAGVENPQWLRGLVVSRGRVSAKGPINDALILATGNVTTGERVHGSVVICDGDVAAGGHLTGSLVIARGNITIGGNGTHSTLIAGGTITFTNPSRPFQGAEVVMNPIVREQDDNPLGYIKFFELSTVGVEVKLADAAITLTAVAAGKPFARAGVKVGDVITEVNGQKPESAEALRQQLRDALAVGDATVTIRRDEKTQTVTVALPE